MCALAPPAMLRAFSSCTQRQRGNVYSGESVTAFRNLSTSVVSRAVSGGSNESSTNPFINNDDANTHSGGKGKSSMKHDKMNGQEDYKGDYKGNYKGNYKGKGNRKGEEDSMRNIYSINIPRLILPNIDDDNDDNDDNISLFNRGNELGPPKLNRQNANKWY